MTDTTTDNNDLILTLSRLTDAVRDGIDIDNMPKEHWFLPLEAVLPIEECAGFMFMGAVEAQIVPSSRSFIGQHDADEPNDDWERRLIFRYKHGITRRYLNLSTNLRPYYYVGSTADWSLNTYAHHVGGADPARQLERALLIAFQDIEKFGATRSTAYNDAYIAERNARLVAAGYLVVS